jgi:hypothetical protein
MDERKTFASDLKIILTKCTNTPLKECRWRSWMRTMNLFTLFFPVIFAETQLGAMYQLLDIANPFFNFDLLESREPEDTDYRTEPDEDLMSFLDNMKVFAI